MLANESEQRLQAALQAGRNALVQEADVLKKASERLSKSFADCVAKMATLSGKVVVAGLGKSGHVARKIAATLASTGTPAFFLHPSEALHGDLGMLQSSDALLAVAYSGETEETNSVARYAKRLGIPVVAIVGRPDSTLAKLADFVLDGSVEREVCPHNLAPTSSTTVAMALGDSLAVALMTYRGFSAENFANFHPGGALGRRLSSVSDYMHAVEGLPTLQASATFTEILDKVTKRNFGIVPVVDKEGILKGSISDGDLRRALAKFREKALALKAGEFMSGNPKTIEKSTLALNAFKKMEEHQITSLFVVSKEGSLEGLIRMHDLLAAKIV
jgi:arabinose-5-phosphate isomerase